MDTLLWFVSLPVLRTAKVWIIFLFEINQRIERVENIAIEAKQLATETEKKIEFLTHCMEDILADQNDVNEDTRTQFNEIYQALTGLAERRKESDKPRNPIGFIQHKKK